MYPKRIGKVPSPGHAAGPRKLGNSESGICVSLQTGPKRGPRKLGNSESGICPGVSRNLHTRNLGIWNLRSTGVSWNLPTRGITRNLEIGVPPRTYRGALESWKLGIWNLPGSILESAHSESWNLEFAEEYPGICPRGNKEFGNWVPSADLQRGLGILETRKLGIWNLQRSILESAHLET